MYQSAYFNLSYWLILGYYFSFNLKKPDQTVVKDESIAIESNFVTLSVTGGEVGSLLEDTLFTVTLTCTQGSETLTIVTKVMVYATESQYQCISLIICDIEFFFESFWFDLTSLHFYIFY